MFYAHTVGGEWQLSVVDDSLVQTVVPPSSMYRGRAVEWISRS